MWLKKSLRQLKFAIILSNFWKNKDKWTGEINIFIPVLKKITEIKLLLKLCTLESNGRMRLKWRATWCSVFLLYLLQGNYGGIAFSSFNCGLIFFFDEREVSQGIIARAPNQYVCLQALQRKCVLKKGCGN